MRRWGLRAAWGSGALLALLTAAILAAHLPVTEPLRRHMLERILTHMWGQPVHVEGAVTMAFRPRLALEALDVTFSAGVMSHARVGQVVLSLNTYAEILADRPVFKIAVADAQFRFLLEDRIRPAPGSILSSPVFLLRQLPHLTLKRVSVDFSAPELGWQFTTQVESLRTFPDGPRERGIAHGTLNGRPLELDFIFDLESDLKGVPASGVRQEGETPVGNVVRSHEAVIRLASESFKSELTVRAPTLDFDHNLAATLSASAANLNDVLALAQIAPIGGGSGHLSAQLLIEPHALSMPFGQLALVLADGVQVSMSGHVEDALRATGMNLSTVAVLNADAPDAVSLRDITVTRLSGDFRDGPKGLMLHDIVISTNAFAENLREIGPIRVQRVTRNAAGQVALQGVMVLAGPADDPIFQLAGSVGSILDFSGVDLGGKVNLPLRDILTLPADSNGDLGRLVGRMAVSDADGTLRLRDFTAKVEGSEVVSARVELKADDLKAKNGPTVTGFDVEIAITDWSRVARALGFSSLFTGPVRFSGQLDGTADKQRAQGRLDIGRTQIDGQLSYEVRGERSFVSGRVHSPSLDLDDIGRFASPQTAIPSQRVTIAGLTPPPEGSRLDPMAFVDADIRLTADRLQGPVQGASGIDARVVFQNGVLRGDPVRVRYGGGQISAVVTGLGGSGVRARGSGQGWPLSTFFSGRRGGVTASGTIRMTFDLTAQPGANLVRTLSGTLVARIRNGRLGTGMLNLAGLGIIGGLFDRGVHRGTTPLRCVQAPFRFTNGVGRTNSVIVVDTDSVRALARGTVNLVRNSVDLGVVPRPLNAARARASGLRFTIRGGLDRPSVAIGPVPDIPGNFRCN